MVRRGFAKPVFASSILASASKFSKSRAGFVSGAVFL